MDDATNIVALVTAGTALISVFAKIIIDNRTAKVAAMKSTTETDKIQADVDAQLWERIKKELSDRDARIDRLSLELRTLKRDYNNYSAYLLDLLQTIAPDSRPLTLDQWKAKNTP